MNDDKLLKVFSLLEPDVVPNEYLFQPKYATLLRKTNGIFDSNQILYNGYMALLSAKQKDFSKTMKGHNNKFKLMANQLLASRELPRKKQNVLYSTLSYSTSFKKFNDFKVKNLTKEKYNIFIHIFWDFSICFQNKSHIFF